MIDEVTWRNDVDKSNDYVMYLETTETAQTSAFVKRDGCVDLRVQTQHVHICDVDAMIRCLQSLKEHAIKHFKEWPQE